MICPYRRNRGSIEKTSGSLHIENLSLGDQLNMVFSGTMITTGNGLFCVTETGMNTQIGKIAGMLSHEQAPQTPLTRRLNHTGKVLGILALIICAILFFLGLQKNQPVFDMFMTSVSLGVAAIPESLPALVTIMLVLALSAWQNNVPLSAIFLPWKHSAVPPLSARIRPARLPRIA